MLLRYASPLAAAAVALIAACAPVASMAAGLSERRAFDPLPAGHALARRAPAVNYSDPNENGGQMLTIIPGLDVGEPINVIVSGLSDPSVLSIEGFFLWCTSVHFGVSCLGQANGTQQSANLGNGPMIQGSGDGDNGVMRWNYYSPYVGTCRETIEGGNHFRWWKQQGTNAFFLATSVELSLATNHMIALNGYNNGRDELVGNATFSNGTEWEGNLYNTTVEMIPAGVLLNATSEGINHPSVALPGEPTQDGRVALLTIRQLESGSVSNGAASAFRQGEIAGALGTAALVIVVAALALA